MLAELPCTPLNIFVDPVRLAPIFSNLLDNVSTYKRQGGDIALALNVPDQTIMIVVSDNGIGIPAEALPGIFNLSVQDARALDYSSGGLGIGLAVVRELVEAHGGNIIGQSAGSNLGSEFIVTLPIEYRPQTGAGGMRPPAQPC